MHIALSFHKGSKGRNTVSNEVVRLAENVQIYLGHFRLQVHHFYLKRGKQEEPSD